MKRKDLQKILLIGSGPIVIGQGCEFDYSGTQACKALRAIGHKVVLVNSNPATIMTDPNTADVTYIEALTVEALTKIIEKERPDAILPTLGGQTGLNLAIELHKKKILAKYQVEMLGASPEVIHKAEDRLEFKKAMDRIGLLSARSSLAFSLEEAREASKEIGYPVVVRPAYTLGGSGGGIAWNELELNEIVADGLRSSLISEVLIEKSLLAWKEYELELMRDKKDNVVIVCSIENLDPMGVHTGDSITVAPAQTLSDKEYQMMRDASIKIMREIGVETGGANVQFAINPKDGQMIVIEMNPRVSRSSALASKATGFPIAKCAAKLAVGYTLDEIQNDITKETPACFEPTLDYVVTKIPRFHFEKFPSASKHLSTVMKSVGETMAIGRTFKESFQKALRSLETKRQGFGFDKKDFGDGDLKDLVAGLQNPSPERLFYIKLALENNFNLEQIHDFTKIDPWFLHQMKQLVDFAKSIKDTKEHIYYAKQLGFSDAQLANLLHYKDEIDFRQRRLSLDIKPVYKLVDTCAGEFEAYTPYYYSTYEEEDELKVSSKKSVMVLGSGPNRIGQGIEFDYCCVQASYSLRELGYESIMLNSNPETVSTDFDSSDKLFFEALSFEDVLNVYEKEKPFGVIIQFGGQTPLNLAQKLKEAGVNILGTTAQNIEKAEDREAFSQVVKKVGAHQAKSQTVLNKEDALKSAKEISYPVIVRPSFVLGGASMKICYTESDLKNFVDKAIEVSEGRSILIEEFLADAIELDVDAVSDGKTAVVCGLMEHIEAAGVHSGDSMCSLPPFSVPKKIQKEIVSLSKKLAKEFEVIGLLNIQFALKDDKLYIIEVNPRASRTVPFVSKATGTPWVSIASKVILGQKLKDMNLDEDKKINLFHIKEAILPFKKFKEDPLLSPEMKATGEVMTSDKDFHMALYKAFEASSSSLPLKGKILCDMGQSDLSLCKKTQEHLNSIGFECVFTDKTKDLSKIDKDNTQLLISLDHKDCDQEAQSYLRKEAQLKNIPIISSKRMLELLPSVIKARQENDFEVKSLQSF